MIELDTTMYYISIFISLLSYYWLIIRHESIISYTRIRSELRKHPIKTLVTSSPNSYLATSAYASVFILKIWKPIW
jgi:hypothetical protein